MQVEYSKKPEQIAYMLLPDGQADVWLRKNIVKVTQETEEGTAEIWTADEVYFRTTLSEEEITENFEAIFKNGGVTVDEETGEEVADGITTIQRVEALEEAVADLAELYAEVIG